VPPSRHRRFGVLAFPLAILVLLGSSLPSGPVQPLGEVLDVVAAAPTPAPVTPGRAIPLDPRLAYVRSTDRDGPKTGWELVVPQPESLTGYTWPLRRGRLTLPFKAIPGGTRIKDGKLFHDGIDLATFCGDTVRAAHDGVVLAAGRKFDDVIGWLGDLGPYYRILDRKQLWDDLPLVVVIDDGNGYRSIYAHFSKISVAVGDVVRAEQKIGLEGRTGHASGCHVHYGLFSPLESATFGVRADLLKKLRLPIAEIARIDPLIVMPGGAEVLRTRRFPAPVLPPSPAPRAAVAS
jgi:murein DD-endopeptidase MepM/ murein hydrolase activator NlpD